MLESKDTLVFFGTYNVANQFFPIANGEGVYVYRLDLASGSLEYVSHSTGIKNPSFLTVGPSNTKLYVTSEMFEPEESYLHAYDVDPKEGVLRHLNKQLTMGELPAYVCVDRSGRYAMVADYWSGDVAIFPVNEDGSLQPVSDSVKHAGRGPNDQRQEGPHAHCAVVDPGNRYLFVADLGVDKVFSYKIDFDQGKLTPNDPPWLELQPGGGPRHMVFHSTGKYAYVTTELDSAIVALTYDQDRGRLQILETVSTLPEGFRGNSTAADIQIHPSNQFLYASNRGNDSIVIYAVDQATGRLSYVGHQSTLGKTPRSFAIDPTGQWLLAANQDSETVVSFRINQENGGLQPTDPMAHVGSPACVKVSANISCR